MTTPTLQWLTDKKTHLIALVQTNTTLRMKYPGQPMRYYISQEEINNLVEDDLGELGLQHLPLVAQSNILHPLLTLLTHPNNDVCSSCVQLLFELLHEEPTDDDAYSVYFNLCVEVVEKGLIEGLVGCILKMDEQHSVEEYEVVLEALTLLQTLLQTYQKAINNIEDTLFLQYLAERMLPNFKIAHKTLDDNKYKASDLLVLLLTKSPQITRRFGALHGVEVVVQALAPLTTPNHADLIQFMLNLMDCLTLLFLYCDTPALTPFHTLQGLPLLFRLLKAKAAYSISALKAIAAAVTACLITTKELIQVGALRYLFAILARKGLKGKDVEGQRSIDEHVLAILFQMAVEAEGVHRLRVGNKFSEGRFEKLEKLFEIRQEYGDEAEEGDYMKRVWEGLGVVEGVEKLILVLIKYQELQPKIRNLLKMYSVDPHTVQHHIQQAYQFTAKGPQKVQLARLLAHNIPLLISLTQ